MKVIILPMKAAARLAYRRAGVEFDGVQSDKMADYLHDSFAIVHLPEEVTPPNEQDEESRLKRQRELAERWARPGQARFRAVLLKLCGSACVVTGCRALDAIDAAHVTSVGEQGDDRTENGLILRADLHRLFDAHLMSIEPKTFKVAFSKDCREDYSEHEGSIISIPSGGPPEHALAVHWHKFINR